MVDVEHEHGDAHEHEQIGGQDRHAGDPPVVVERHFAQGQHRVGERGDEQPNRELARLVAEERLDVRLPNGSVYTIEKETWDNRGYKFDREKKTIVSEVKGRLIQYPVKLAWAITIHKSQGLTFDKVIIDMGRGAFVPGQLYTALSRCRSLEGIVLKRPVSQRDVIRDEKLIEFYQSIGDA